MRKLEVRKSKVRNSEVRKSEVKESYSNFLIKQRMKQLLRKIIQILKNRRNQTQIKNIYKIW